MQLTVERLYLKDVSFESPRSPDVFTGQWQPEVQLDINTRSNPVASDKVEVVLTVTARAKLKDSGKTAFIVEVQQAGLFGIGGEDDAAKNRVLGTVCPNMLFPYVRETIDSLCVKGGFPALALAPVNFDAVFEQARKGGDEVAH